MGGVDAWGNTTQKYHQLGEVETTNNTTQYLELTGLNTSYAMLEFVFTGWIDHSGGGGTNIGAGQWTDGPSLQMQGAWPGGPDAGACFYRSLGGFQYDSSTSTYDRMGDWISSSSAMLSPNFGRIGRLWYPSGTVIASESRFTFTGICVGPGDNTAKSIHWNGGGNIGPGSTSYMSTVWLGNTHLCTQTSGSDVRSIGPMDSVRIGAGTDNAGNPKYFGSYSKLVAYGAGKSDAFGR